MWDLAKSQPERTIRCRLASNIVDVCEIASLSLIGVVQGNRDHVKTEECRISLYHFLTGEMKVNVYQPNGKIPHSISFSNLYQVLLTAGFEKELTVYEINPKDMDYNVKGELIGHESLVTSFTVLQKTPLVVSSDDRGKVKMWDIRTRNCIQTISFCSKSMISKVLGMPIIGRVGVFGSRVSFIGFEEIEKIKREITLAEKCFPVNVEQDSTTDSLIVFSEKDLRVIDLSEGRLRHVLCGFGRRDEDVTFVQYFSCLRKFAVGNSRGKSYLYGIKSGEIEG